MDARGLAEGRGLSGRKAPRISEFSIGYHVWPSRTSIQQSMTAAEYSKRDGGPAVHRLGTVPIAIGAAEAPESPAVSYGRHVIEK
jgi:hypothetical protein